MKHIFLYCLATICLLVSSASCTTNEGKNGDQVKEVENKFSTAADALNQTIKNLPALLSDGLRKSYGLGSDDEIKALKPVKETPVAYLSLSSLRDSGITNNNEAVLYGLGSSGPAKICVSIKKIKDGWMQSAIGMKVFVNAMAANPGLNRVVEVPGLSLSLLELKDSLGTIKYTPITDYPEAELTARERYKDVEVLRKLEAYRAKLEKQFGKDFSAGNLDR